MTEHAVREPFKPYHVPKPWGSEFVWALTNDYAAKVLTINPGQRLSLQQHEKKDETILVLAGPVLVTHGEEGAEPFEVEDGGIIHVLPGTIHRFAAPEGVKVTLVEASTPHLEDVTRLDDDYKRSPHG